MSSTYNGPTLCLVACSASKQPHAAPARELYTGVLFQAARAFAEGCDHWYIVSALHGLVEPEQELEPYNVSIRDWSDRKAWGDRVRADLAHRWEGVEGVRLVVLLGADYADAIPWNDLPASWSAAFPLRGLPIGKQIAFLRTAEDRPLTWAPVKSASDELTELLMLACGERVEAELVVFGLMMGHALPPCFTLRGGTPEQTARVHELARRLAPTLAGRPLALAWKEGPPAIWRRAAAAGPEQTAAEVCPVTADVTRYKFRVFSPDGGLVLSGSAERPELARGRADFFASALWKLTVEPFRAAPELDGELAAEETPGRSS